MLRFYTIFLFTILMVSSVIAHDCELVAGKIDYNKSSFSVGDKVWIFNADTSPIADTNGYIKPNDFKHAWLKGVVISEPNKRGLCKIYYKETLPDGSKYSGTFNTYATLPQQSIVFWDL